MRRDQLIIFVFVTPAPDPTHARARHASSTARPDDRAAPPRRPSSRRPSSTSRGSRPPARSRALL
eukprot:6345880-Prymnesium_polylepis.2